MTAIDTVVINDKKYLVYEEGGGFGALPFADNAVLNDRAVKTAIIRFVAEKRKHPKPKRGRPPKQRLVYRESPPCGGTEDDD